MCSLQSSVVLRAFASARGMCERVGQASARSALGEGEVGVGVGLALPLAPLLLQTHKPHPDPALSTTGLQAPSPHRTQPPQPDNHSAARGAARCASEAEPAHERVRNTMPVRHCHAPKSSRSNRVPGSNCTEIARIAFDFAARAHTVD
eukprot:1201087-Rhodomonas_salina.2